MSLWNLLAKINNILIPIVLSFCVWTVTQIHSQDNRLRILEEWKGGVGSVHEREAEALRMRIMRDVETASSAQRENVLAQLASLQRDIVRIMVLLEIRSNNGNPSGKSGGSKEGDSLWPTR